METQEYALFAVGLLVALSFGYLFVLPALQQAQPLATPTPAPRLAQFNDTVEVDYILRLQNGSIYDTTLEAEARAAGIWRQGVEYKPFSFMLGAGQVVPGFERAILGMREGETKEAIVPPSEGYGDYDPQLLSPMARIYEISRFENVSLQDLLAAYPDFTNETRSIPLGRWNASVFSISGDVVTLRHDIGIGAVIQTRKWPETVINVTDETIQLRRDPTENELYLVETEQGLQLATVKSVNEQIIILDFNPPLASQTLNFTIRLVRILNSTHG